MNEDNIQKEIIEDVVEEDSVNIDSVAVSPVIEEKQQNFRGKREFKKNPRRQSGRAPRERIKPEFDQKIIEIRRVTRVVTGGRRFSFSVAVVAGDHNGRVGIGSGKASDTPIAIEKAFRSAKKNMIKIHVTKNGSIPHEVRSKFSASRVMIIPAPGKGVLAGSSVRTVLELAGIKGVNAKIVSPSKNKVNNAKAAIKALMSLQLPRVSK
jgi:small subunit ribosomal protein S5